MTTRKKLFAILNPVAGSCDSGLVQDTLQQYCTRYGYQCEIFLTRADSDVSAIAAEAVARGYDRIIAGGGDGTVAAVATALVSSTIPLGILPVGTANLLARELNIPLELDAACELAISGKPWRALDALRIGEQVFFSHVSIGVYSKIAAKTSAVAKRHFRQIAYIWNALPELLGRRSWRFRLEIDGVVSYPRASFILIANVGGLGAGTLRWGPDIAPDDGEVDICIVRARSLWEYIVFAWHVLRHRHHLAPRLSYARAKRSIAIHCRKNVPVRGDGEIVGQSTLQIEILPQSLSVITPDIRQPEVSVETPASIAQAV